MARQQPFFLARTLVIPGRGRPRAPEAYGRPYVPAFGEYPAPRVDRIGAAVAGPAVAGTGAPTAHVLPFTLAAGAANQRSAASFGPFIGPAIVRGIHFAKGGVAGGNQGITLGKSTQAITEVNVGVAVPLPWTPLFDPMGTAGAAAPNAGPTDNSVDFQPDLLSNDTDLGFPILDPQFFLVVAVFAGAGFGSVFSGRVTLLEQVASGALANFL